LLSQSPNSLGLDGRPLVVLVLSDTLGFSRIGAQSESKDVPQFGQCCKCVFATSDLGNRGAPDGLGRAVRYNLRGERMHGEAMRRMLDRK